MNSKIVGFEKKEILLFAVLCLVGVAALWLRLWQLPLQLLADDEWHALNKLLASSGAGEIYTSFGYSDHSIPVTLYYYFVSRVVPLTENIMRFPMIVAGLATPFVVILFCKRLLNRQESAILFVLLALSPMLIYYARTARPYAISTLLVVVALLAFYYWASKPSARWAILYLVSTSLAAWMQPVTLTFSLTPFLFYGAKSLSIWRAEQRRDLFQHVLVLGGIQVIVLTVLLGPPVYHNLEDLSAKAGVDTPTLESITRAFKMLTGSEYILFLFAYVAFALVGIYTLWKRHPEFVLYSALCVFAPLLVILFSGAAWIQHSLVMARYALPLLVLMTIAASVGISQAFKLPGRSAMSQALAISFLAAGIFSAGPLYRQYNTSINQFTGHMAYQFDYDWEKNVYNTQLEGRPVSSFYKQLGEQPEGQLHLVVAPWFMEWHENPWYLDQDVHQQVVTAGFMQGFCGSSFYGEYSPDNTSVALKNVAHISELNSPSNAGKFDYLVYHKNASRGELDEAQYKHCLQEIRREFGTPEYEDSELVAYRLNKE